MVTANIRKETDGPKPSKLKVNNTATDNDDKACEAALGWIARLRSDQSSEEDRQAFALWLGQDAANARAMDQMLDLWDDLGVVGRLRDNAALSRESANSARWLAGSVALAASLVLAVVLWPQLDIEEVSTHYQTAIGEIRQVELPDASTVTLNTDSAISVTYTEEQRHINLEQGEAWFQVTANRERPFHVDAGEARVSVLGTAFNVYRHKDAVDVTVAEGVVRVTELGETGNRAATSEVLHVQQQLSVGKDGWKINVVDNLDQQLAWQRGEVIAREMPLPDLIAQIQRYNQTRILLADPELAVRTVSGVFQLDQPEALLDALAISLDLQVQRLDDDTVQLLKTEQ